MGTTAQKLNKILETKEAIRTAINNKGGTLTTTDTFASYPSAIDSLPSGGGGSLKALLDATKSCYYLFYFYKGESVNDLISYNDTENVTNMQEMFRECMNLTTIPRLNTSKSTNISFMFYGCPKLTTIEQIDMYSVTKAGNTFSACPKLTYLKLLNIKISVRIGSGTSFGHLIEKDCLIQIISELIKPSSGINTLTMGNTNIAKLSDTYVKLLDDDGSGKYPFEVCKSTDEGAMTITDYCTYKSWQLA